MLTITYWIIELTSFQIAYKLTHSLCYVPFKERKKKKQVLRNPRTFTFIAGRGGQKNSKLQQLTAARKEKDVKMLIYVSYRDYAKETLVKLPGSIVCEWPLYHPKNSLDFKRSFSYIYRSTQVTKKLQEKR